MKRSGFTLVELLVVVAIIALLISILAPSLKSAKDLAKQTLCQTNLHGVGSGTIMYAEANRAKLPGWTYPASPGQTSELVILDTLRNGYGPISFICTHRLTTDCKPYLDPANGRPQPWGIVSMLLFRGTIGNANMIYCPALTDGQASRACWPDPYGQNVNKGIYLRTDGEQIMKCSFPYNPHCDLVGDLPVFKYKNLEVFPSNQILSADPFYNSSWGTTAHATSGETSPTWNRLYIDSHVSTKVSASAYLFISQSTDPSPGDDWGLFGKVLSYIQE